MHSQIPKVRYFLAFCFCALLMQYGQILLTTATDDSMAVIAYKISYFAIPFQGLLGLLFACDYGERRAPPKPLLLILFVFSFAVFAFVQLYPSANLVHNNIRVDFRYIVPTGTSEPGPLYFPAMVYSQGLGLLGNILILVYFLREQSTPRFHKIAICVLATLPMLTFTLKLAGVIKGYDPVPTSTSICAIYITWFVVTHKFSLWIKTGRHAMVEEMDEGFLSVAKNGKLLDINPAAKRFFPVLKDLPIGTQLMEVENFPADLMDPSVNELHLDLSGDGSDESHFLITRTDLYEGNEQLGISVLFVDNTEAYNITEQLRVLSRHDPLTKLFNRAAFFSDATRDWALALRNETPLAVMMLDIDYFKKVNDTYGHAAGDVVLQGIAKVLTERLRETDVVARYGGEEFVVALSTSFPDGARVVAEDIRTAVERESFYCSESVTVKVTISIGISGLRKNEQFEDILKRADEALYEAKDQGRNRVVCAPDFTDFVVM
jgi:diguanylate cyclase (GGDEF)-like protein